MKKKLIAICLMFAFAFPFASQATDKSPGLMVPAYVAEQDHGTMQAEDVSRGMEKSVALPTDRHRQSGAVAASIKETDANNVYALSASIGAGSGGVHGGGTIGISKTS